MLFKIRFFYIYFYYVFGLFKEIEYSVTKLTFSSYRQSKWPEADSFLVSEDLDPYISTRRKRKRSTKRERER